MKKNIVFLIGCLILLIKPSQAQVNGAILQGTNVTASGQYSSAIGHTAKALGAMSFAGGWNATAEGNVSFAFGDYSIAKLSNAVALGANAQAYRPFTIAIGNNTVAGMSATPFSGTNAICIGNQSHAEADYSMALGQYVKSGGNNSIVIGKGYSTSQYLINNTANSMAIGFGSTLPTLFISNSASATTTGKVGIGLTNLGSKFQVNGGAAIGYSNSMVAPDNGLLVSGNVGIGTTSATTTEKLTINGKVKTTALVLPDGEITSVAGLGGWNKSGNNIYNSNSGNVGIGTTTIGSKLQVNGNAAIGYSNAVNSPVNGFMVKGNSIFEDNIIVSTTNTITSSADITSSPGISIKQAVQKNYSVIDFKNGNDIILGRISTQEFRNIENNALQGGTLTFNILNSNNTYTKLLSLNNMGVLELGNPNATDFSIMAKSNMMLQRPNGNLHFIVDNSGNPRIYSSAYKTLKFFADGLWQLVEFNNIKSTYITATSEIIVQANAEEWKDCVFKSDYDLKPLSEVEQFVKTNQHLPEIPSASEIEKNGIPLKQMNALLLQKIEELTLYVIEQQKEIQQLKVDMSAVKSK